MQTGCCTESLHRGQKANKQGIDSKEMDIPKVLSVQALENKKLLVQFVNSVEKIYNCKAIMGKFEPSKL